MKNLLTTRPVLITDLSHYNMFLTQEDIASKNLGILIENFVRYQELKNESPESILNEFSESLRLMYNDPIPSSRDIRIHYVLAHAYFEKEKSFIVKAHYRNYHFESIIKSTTFVEMLDNTETLLMLEDYFADNYSKIFRGHSYIRVLKDNSTTTFLANNEVRWSGSVIYCLAMLTYQLLTNPRFEEIYSEFKEKNNQQ